MNLNFRKEKINISSSGTFIGVVEKDLLKPSNYNKIKGNNITEERKALKRIQSNELRSYLLQNKLSHFLFLDGQNYMEKIDYQFERGSFEELDHDLSESFSEKVNLWFQKWIEDKGLDKSWGKFIEPSV